MTALPRNHKQIDPDAPRPHLLGEPEERDPACLPQAGARDDALAPAAVPSPHPSPAEPRRRWSRLRVRLLALLVAGLGVLNLWSALLANGPGRAELLQHTAHMPLVIAHNSRTVIAVFGLGLLMLARSLARRKRQAWRLAVLMLAIAPFAHLFKGLDWEEALVCVALLAWLLVERHAFFAANDRPRARQGAIAAAGLFLFAAVYGPCGFFLLAREYHPAVTLPRAVLQTVDAVSLTSERPSFLFPDSKRALWFENSLPLLALFALGYGGFMLLRPSLPPLPGAELRLRERARAHHLLEAWGGPPLAAFATLLEDKRYLFDPSAGSPAAWCVAYVLVGRHAVALGDPLGDPARAEEAIAAFLDHCQHHDWSPSFYQVTGRFLPAYRHGGPIPMKALRVGDEAVIGLPAFTLKGKSFQDLRTSLNKMSKLGVVLEQWSARELDADPATMEQLQAISAAWLRGQKGQEKTFALGRFDPTSALFHRSRLLLARETATDCVLAFTTYVPVYDARSSADRDSDGAAAHAAIQGWNLDLMRRADDAPGGIMEFLLTSAALLFQKEGACLLSLGLSPLSSGDDPVPSAEPASEAVEDPLIARARAMLYEHFGYFYSFRGLHAFKEKFAPAWEPRYLIYPGNTILIATIYAILRAHSPGGLWRYVKR
jgi:phosphatidylglycerol lysyltransferase